MTKLLPIILVMLLMTIASATAVLIVKPADSAMDVCGSTNFSATIITAATARNVSFYWNNSGTLVHICSRTNDTVADGLSYSCTASTATITDGAQNLVAKVTNITGAVVEINVSAVNEFDNAGPVITFASDSTGDGNRVDKSSDFKISITTNEAATAPYVTISGKQFLLTDGGSSRTWTHTFTDTELAQGFYTYTITPTTDNTTCATAGTPVSRDVNIKESQGAKAGSLASASAAASAGRSEEVAQQSLLDNKTTRTLGLAAVVVVIYMLFFHKKKGKK